MLIAKIAVDGAAYHFDKAYDYAVPAAYAALARQGCRVLVPFGAGNKRRQGVILSVQEAPAPEKALKAVALVLDEQVSLTDELMALVEYLKENTFCTYYDAVKTLLPAGLGYQLGSVYRVNPQPPAGEPGDDAARVLRFVDARGAPVYRERLCEACGLTPESPVLTELVNGGWLLCEEVAKRKIGDETVTMARLAPDGLPEGVKLTQKQRAVTELLTEVGSASVKEIGYFTGTTQAIVKALEKKGVVELFENQVLRTPQTQAQAAQPALQTLTDEQTAAYRALHAALAEDKPFVSLLYGVTGSGKTSVFLRLIEDVVRAGRGVVVLVPEISLTPQTIGLFTARFGERVALLHSGLSMGERLDEWRRIRCGGADIAVGTRSAVFAPFEDIGLIIMDEEQEATYKSEQSPRYHARDVALWRAARHKAHVLLCSATPSIESYHHAKTGRYRLLTLQNRYGDAVLPGVEVVDMDAERRAGNAYAVSRVLGEEIAENLRRGEQTILLLNRRGYRTVVKCETCSTPVTCPNCSIGLTYHQANGRLMCHYCGYSRALAQKCEVCGSQLVKYAGEGTQRLEEELHTLFPSARVLRMDADTTMAKYSYERAFASFAAGGYDIMVGTQMVAKGLNFPNVTLVGVLAADGTLYGDNFKSAERTFSLLTQVVGRSGRGTLAGRAYIQTFFPENELFALAARQDYEKFYENELATRQLMLYPPFCRLFAVGFAAPEERAAGGAAKAFLEVLTALAQREYAQVPLRILGPTPGAVPRVSGKYRYKLMIKCKNTPEFRELLGKALITFGRDSAAKGVNVHADPYFDGAL